jgi:hypothetical protein
MRYPWPRFIRSALAGALVLLPLAVSARPQPRLGLYGTVHGDGWPFVRADGSLDSTAIAQAARFDELVLDAFPIVPYRPGLVAALRSAHPDLRLHAYVLADRIWPVADTDSLVHLPTLIRRTVRDLDGFLHDRLTGGEYAYANINLARRVNGRFIVAEALAGILRDRVIASGLFDGLFVDLYCHTVGWTENGTPDRIDALRAGYPDLASLDLAWAEASDTLAALLRRGAPPGFTLMGNCGASAEHAWFNGWMSENFPYQQGGDWTTNMLGDAWYHGYLHDDHAFVPQPLNWLLGFADETPGNEYREWNTKRARLGVASAALGEGVHALGPPDKSTDGIPFHSWWYDEYAVDLATARASDRLQHTGWLGEPLGPAQHVITLTSAPDAVVDPGFEGRLEDGWAFPCFPPAVALATLDSSVRVEGRRSVRLRVDSVGPGAWQAKLVNRGRLSLLSGVDYAVTFWCRSDAPRVLEVSAEGAGVSSFLVTDTSWHRLQAVLRPTQSVSAGAEFRVGDHEGTVWIDDVHFQQGQKHHWRRDFANGLVLVNPMPVAQTLALGAPFRRILGQHETVVDNGTRSSTQTVAANDALLLLRDLDVTAPELTVTSPVSGEVWPVGATRTIRWNARDDWTVTGVDLSCTLRGEKGTVPIASGVPNTGAFEWALPRIDARSARIKVTAHDGWNHSTSRNSGYFTVSTTLAAEAVPTEFALGVVTPNPVRGPLHCAFSLAETGPVRATVVDLLGRECLALADGVFAAGPHALSAELHDPLAPGLYWLVLRSREGTRVRRFVLVH